MQTVDKQNYTYNVGHVTFIVTSVYKDKQGETIPELLLKLMKAEVEHKE